MTSHTGIVELACERLPQAAGEPAGFTFVLLHGWARSRSDWIPLARDLAAIAPVVLVDLRGHGGSPTGADMELPHVTADVHALLDRLGLERAIAVAHSAGGEVAAVLARQDPGRIIGLAVIDPAFGLPDSDRARIKAVAGRLASEDPERVVTEHFAKFGASPLLPTLPETGSALAAGPGTVRDMFLQFAFGPGVLHFESQARAFFDAFPVPVLAIYRSEQRADIARRVFATTEADIRVLPGGHWTHHEYPGEVLGALTAWSAVRVRVARPA